jgi:signal transduction histidine kinase
MQEDASLSRGYEGNGLELSIAKKFMELIGGRIWFESVKGEGSVFYFTIPYDKR